MIPRILEPHLLRFFKQYPVITLTGPRQSGKTTLCRSAFPSLAYANLEELDTRRFAIDDPRGFLAQFSEGAILDEIQRAPDLPSFIQSVVDEKNQPGQFILTGSQQFEVTHTIRQSLAGRTAVLKLLPFAFHEIYRSSSPPRLSELLYTGFYPRIFDQKLNPTEALSFYVSTYLERDLQSFIQVREMNAFERFIKICATQIGQITNLSRIGNDCGVDQKTVKSWLSLLEASYIIFVLQPHFVNFRKRLIKSPKLYFYDVGLAAYLLGITNPDQLEAHPLKGALFENFVIGEFLKNRYNQVKENNLYFFRDHMGNEVDLVLDYGNGLITVEIKSGATLNPDFFKGLAGYARLSKKRNQGQYLVYGGDKQQVQQGVNVYPYFEIDALLNRLPE